MKKVSTATLCIFLGLVLFLGGIFLGAYKGWNQEYQVLQTIAAQPNDLDQALAYQQADISNLLVIAGRHLPKDEAHFTALYKSRQQLLKSLSLREQKKVIDQLPGQVEALAELLKQTPSFLNSQRDQIYLSTLEKDLSSLRFSAQASLYNQAAQSFNQRLSRSFTGKIASLFGVGQAPIF